MLCVAWDEDDTPSLYMSPFSIYLDNSLALNDIVDLGLSVAVCT